MEYVVSLPNVGRVGAVERLAAGGGVDIPDALHSGSKALAGFANMGAGHVCRCRDQRIRVVGQLFHLIVDCLCFHIHGFYGFELIVGRGKIAREASALR